MLNDAFINIKASVFIGRKYVNLPASTKFLGSTFHSPNEATIFKESYCITQYLTRDLGYRTAINTQD